MSEFEHIQIPADGTRITAASDGQLSVPDNPILPFIEGDGIGPDIWRASQRVFDATVAKAYGGRRQVCWMEVFAGEKAHNKLNSWLPDETIKAFQSTLREYRLRPESREQGLWENLRLAVLDDYRRLQGRLGAEQSRELGDGGPQGEAAAHRRGSCRWGGALQDNAGGRPATGRSKRPAGRRTLPGSPCPQGPTPASSSESPPSRARPCSRACAPSWCTARAGIAGVSGAA